ncbi:hypothetical protein QJS04_geneDACA004427 [Acorus gramineus]|uniref:Uncharacterized protein n=1 Tax=Acorus gramineus TaxID=55184 RepID=A0AAV9B468_ACOGR|nr:hypothetical protein QJS04_geneDACA004427 [Acorus gramineus]
MDITKKQQDDPSGDTKIWNHMYAYADSLILRCAAELKIADAIHSHGEPITLHELAASNLPLSMDHLHRLMRYLVKIKIFTMHEGSDEEPKYGLTPASKILLNHHERCMSPTILMMTDPDFLTPWHHLIDGLDGESTAFEKAMGKGIWDYMSENPEKSRMFNEAMAADTRLLTSALIRDCEGMFGGIGSLVDVGGGTGTALRAIARAFPHVRCTVYDLPHVIAESPAYPEIERAHGNMFESIPPAEAVLMKCILHDWDDKECIEILKKCKEAVPRDGKVIIVDVVLEMGSKHPFNKWRMNMDLDMMINTGGKERTEEEWKELIYAAGFAGYSIKNISALQSVIETYPY